jgi:hypothetical protein
MGNIDFENKVKSLADIVVLNNIRKVNSIIDDFKLVARGGGALNYYFDNIIATHDWDFGFMKINPNYTYNQKTFNSVVNRIEKVAKVFVDNLNYFFKYYVKHTSYKNLKFVYKWQYERLLMIEFDYIDPLSKNGDSHTNSVIDIFISDNIESGVKHPRFKRKISANNLSLAFWKPKIKTSDIIDYNEYRRNLEDFKYATYENNFTASGEKLYKSKGNLKNTLFNNKIESVVQDDTSGIFYMAPGDLFYDTVRMLYVSLYEINIKPSNNKTVRYAQKLSQLINTFNKAGICTEKTCSYDITAMVLSRNTNTKDCNGLPIKVSHIFRNKQLSLLIKRGYFDKSVKKLFNLISSKKLCEIVKILT